MVENAPYFSNLLLRNPRLSGLKSRKDKQLQPALGSDSMVLQQINELHQGQVQPYEEEWQGSLPFSTDSAERIQKTM